MFQQPGYTKVVSMRLSEVLADIGMHERIVLKRRRAFLLRESANAVLSQITNENIPCYYFGSQSEGTTTIGLKSDIDLLFCLQGFNVIQDWSEWQPGVRNLLMIRDESASLGYCLLQCLRADEPIPLNSVPYNNSDFRNVTGRILLKNTLISAAAASSHDRFVQHGPAQAQINPDGYVDKDIVPAYRCKSWPSNAKQWLEHQGDDINQGDHWPTRNMRRYCRTSGCFVVGIGSKDSENEEVEWRISTSLAERYLMFSLNITQLRCYVLMKMISKTFFEPTVRDTISSFMCKNVLFHCMANTQSKFWRENNLIVCLSRCLTFLYGCTLSENLQHFIIPENNLMRGKITNIVKPLLIEIMQNIIHSEGAYLLRITCDDLGSRIKLKLNNLYRPPSQNSQLISTCLFLNNALLLNYICKCILSYSRCHIDTMFKYILELLLIEGSDNAIMKTACRMLSTQMCTLIGSTLGSQSIFQNNSLSAKALTWISLGLNTDVASSKLKLASMLYSVGEIHRTEMVLRLIETNYDKHIVEPVCACYRYIGQGPRKGFREIADNHDEEAIIFTVTFCIRFLPCEMNCIPLELRYEMFRSTEEDKAYRGYMDDWMDWAVVDSLPYLYFLQYKTYSHLRREEDKQRALSNLVKTIDREPNLGHRETALNLLGQCMVQENRVREALQCYSLSLKVRKRNNAAKFLICILLSTVANRQ